jgi:CRISPR-associated protein (TIGR03984 family)
MSREIKTVKCTFGKPEKITNPKAAWKEKVESNLFQYLLAHADDGVIWGKVENGKLVLSSKAYPEISPKLRVDTLRELRLFGKEAEWFLWRVEAGWRARLITDGSGPEVDVFTESYILWGTDAVGKAQEPFTLVTEADTGIRHAPPLPFKGRHSLRLVMRHYLGFDEHNAAYIKLSRLVDLENGGKQ